ncbi:MAG: hypothetical protein AUI58_06100 [Chloroflexi bacterium 13_1_40CM_2_70_6]|nr:MAG: hypothetical protein AUI58_06100 [Chloroflexi bacterium 13_1_40CM_2_70_6]
MDVLRGRARVQRDRGVLECFRTEALGERARREDERVAGLDRLSPDVGQHIGLDPEGRGLPGGRAVDEVRELPGLVAGEEEARTPYEEDPGSADSRGVQLVVHDDRARAVERHAPALIAKTLRRAAVRLPQGAAQRDLDARRKVVVVLLAREVGDLARERSRGRGHRRDLAEEIEPALRAECRPERRLTHDRDVGRIGTQPRGGTDLRDEAGGSHLCRV